MNANLQVEFVSSSEVAIGIAIAVWTPLYGKETVDRFRPYKAFLHDDEWHVTGTISQGIRYTKNWGS